MERFYRGDGFKVKRGELNEIVKQISLLGQLGLSIIMPLLMCIALCWYLTTYHGVGLWVYIPGFIFGLGGSAMTVYKFYLSEIRKNKKEEKKTVSFNRHE